jgi:hypothetical protein
MRRICPRNPLVGIAVSICLLLAASRLVSAQSTASVEGQVIDQHGAVIPGVRITASNSAISIERETTSDSNGRYQLPALPIGDYTLAAIAAGFKTQVVDSLRIQVAGRISQDFELETGEVSEQVTISSANTAIERSTSSVGHVIDRRMVQELPLNGRYFLDLGLLVPGSVTPPQGAFSSAPVRGVGSFSITTAGNREEAVSYVINGITLNNLTNASITFQPSIGAVQEFKVDNSTFSAEHGQSSGAVVNIATRSGGNEFHGEVFEFFRNDVLDARNFFTLTANEPPQPVWRTTRWSDRQREGILFLFI